jgi:hypothetical protein
MMRSAVLICLFGLAAIATADVTGYKTASAAVVAKSGKILISTVLTPENAPVNEIQPIEEPSIMPVIQPGNKLPIIERPAIQPLPVVSPPVAPVPVVSPPVAPVRPAPLPAEGGNLIPEIINPEKPVVSILPIAPEKPVVSILPIAPEKPVVSILPIAPEQPSFGLLPVVQPGNKLPVDLPQEPSFSLLPIIEEGQAVINPIEEAEKPSFGLLPVVEEGQAIYPVPPIIEETHPIVEQPSFGLLPVIGEGQNAIQPIVEIGHKLPVVVEVPQSSGLLRPALEPIEEELLLRPKPVSFPSAQGIIR